ncbi:hypothetical protein D3C72_795620 [compost metagenome]
MNISVHALHREISHPHRIRGISFPTVIFGETATVRQLIAKSDFVRWLWFAKAPSFEQRPLPMALAMKQHSLDVFLAIGFDDDFCSPTGCQRIWWCCITCDEEVCGGLVQNNVARKAKRCISAAIAFIWFIRHMDDRKLSFGEWGQFIARPDQRQAIGGFDDDDVIHALAWAHLLKCKPFKGRVVIYMEQLHGGPSSSQCVRS